MPAQPCCCSAERRRESHVAKLIYSATASLDGYVEDASGGIGWTVPDEESHRFVNDLVRPLGTHLYGRRMYETMLYWETAPATNDQPEVMRDFARIWQEADKIVYSATLDSVSSARTRLEREFDPSVVARMKSESPRDLIVGGATLASTALSAGLVDEINLFTYPILLGGGKSYLSSRAPVHLALLDVHRFASGVVYTRYRVAG